MEFKLNFCFLSPRNLLVILIVIISFYSTAYSSEALRLIHINIRHHMILSHLAQATEKSIVIIGDSIVESWLSKPIGDCQVVNAGLGGGRSKDVIAFLQQLKNSIFKDKILGFVIAIGVNDAIRRKEYPENYTVLWQKSYEKMIDIARKIHPGIIVATILPVQDGKALGTKYFDPILIERLNHIIRLVANERNIQLIDLHMQFKQFNWKNDFTIDGVHLTTEAYKVFFELLVLGMETSDISCKQ